MPFITEWKTVSWRTLALVAVWLSCRHAGLVAADVGLPPLEPGGMGSEKGLAR